MTALLGAWLALIAAAVVVSTPSGVERMRRVRVLGTTMPGGPYAPVFHLLAGGMVEARASLRALTGPQRLPAALVPAVAALAGMAGLLAGGPVAAFVAAVYAAVLTRGLRRRMAVRAAAQFRTRELDALGALAADLRAGLPPVALGGNSSTGVGGSFHVGSGGGSRVGTGGECVAAAATRGRLGALASAAVHLAETTGAPLAELLERVEADARAADRAAVTVAAQAAGTRTTAWLLAVLPLGGIGLGYGMGADPLRVLLETPVGAACAVTAVLLQVAGLAWTERLSRAAGGVS